MPKYEKVQVSWDECRDKFWKAVDDFNKSLSESFGVDIDLGDEEWSDLFDELVNCHIEFDDK